MQILKITHENTLRIYHIGLDMIKTFYLMIYKLYKLTYEEVKIVDPAFALSKEEYEKFKIQ